MIFLISLALAVLLATGPSKVLRSHPLPFYLGAVALSIGGILSVWWNFPLPSFFSDWVLPIAIRGGLAGGLFVVVMAAGALPNGSWLIKRWMPVRGPLSILACILTLGHNIAYGKTYFVSLFSAPSALPWTQLLATICSILMILIMIPLFVTSFQKVRKKMAPKSWKKLQRLAYPFYGLLFCHILLLVLPRALSGNWSYLLTAFVYTAIFLSYLVCRLLKRSAVKRRDNTHLRRNQIIAAAICTGASLAGAIVVFLCQLTASAPSSDTSSTRQIGTYQDGVYTGSGIGWNGEITVAVTITDGVIDDVAIVSQREDEEYFSDALAVISAILETNSTDVDTISGATYSSGGILDAVDDALQSAAS